MSAHPPRIPHWDSAVNVQVQIYKLFLKIMDFFAKISITHNIIKHTKKHTKYSVDIFNHLFLGLMSGLTRNKASPHTQ